MKKYRSPENLLLIAGFAGLFILCVLTLLHRQAPLYDEPLFISNMPLFNQYGLSRTFLLEMDNQAPGPLYEMVHYPLQSITHMQPPGLRLVNIVLLWIIIILLVRVAMRQWQLSWQQALVPALRLMALPVVWPVAGMALTEIPPMCCAMLSVWLLQRALLLTAKPLWQGLLLSLLAGTALGLAILGRSPFLVMVPASALLLIGHWRNTQRWMLLAIYVLVALAICVPVFVIWKGLMPPKQALVTAGGFKLWHGILAFAYGALLTAIIGPRWFYFSRRILYVLLITWGVLLVLNIFVLHYAFAPMTGGIAALHMPAVTHYYPFVISPVLATVALYFIACTAARAWEKREEPFILFLLASSVLLLLSCAKVTHLFSSRYVAQAAPFLVLVLVGYDKITYGKCLRFAIGLCMGIISLEAYFHFR